MSVQPDPVALTQRPLSARDRPRSVAWSALIGALIVLALGASFFAWRVLTPSSCAWITADAGSWSSAGVVPRHTDGCPVPDGIAVTDVTRGAHDVAVAFADGSHATLPLTPTLPLAGERLLDGAWTLLFVVSLLALAAYAFVRQPSDRALGAALVFSSGLASSIRARAKSSSATVIVSVPLSTRLLMFAAVSAEVTAALSLSASPEKSVFCVGLDSIAQASAADTGSVTTATTANASHGFVGPPKAAKKPNLTRTAPPPVGGALHERRMACSSG